MRPVQHLVRAGAWQEDGPEWGKVQVCWGGGWSMRRAGETCVDAEKVKLWGLKGRTGDIKGLPTVQERRPASAGPEGSKMVCDWQ